MDNVQHFGIWALLGMHLPALRGDHILEKPTQNENLTIVLLNVGHQPYPYTVIYVPRFPQTGKPWYISVQRPNLKAIKQPSMNVWFDCLGVDIPSLRREWQYTLKNEEPRLYDDSHACVGKLVWAQNGYVCIVIQKARWSLIGVLGGGGGLTWSNWFNLVSLKFTLVVSLWMHST